MAILRRLGSWLGVAFLWLVHLLPTAAIGAIGSAIGSFLYRFGRGRVTDINLALCFPQMPEAERKALARRHFRALGRNALEMSVMWFGSDARVMGLVTMRGKEHIDAVRGRPCIILAPHFIGLNMGGARFAQQYPGSASMYSRQKNPVVDRLFLRGRLRFGEPALFSRQDGLLALVRFVKRGKFLYFLPDMDFGARDALFVDFFGVKAATITALPRLAKVSGAVVVPVVTRQLARGYELIAYPAWENYPSGDLEADVRRMNAFIEERAREMPEQYFWAHKRFKTRPPGELSPYRRR